jgi:hypothetical protein
MIYQLGQNNQVQNVATGAWIPANFENGAVIAHDPESALVKSFVAWVAEGNAPDPYVAPVLTTDQQRDAIDAAADRARRRYVPLESVVPEYQQAEADAIAFKAAGYGGTVPGSVQVWASAKGWTAQQACDDVLTAAAMLRGKLLQIRAVRLQGKEDLTAGKETMAQVIAALDAL